jgi:2-phospho-L-lactate guanylyltransferase (CobY/MobA/RfbA family)
MLLRRPALCIPAQFGEKSCARHFEAAREAGLDCALLDSLADVVCVDLDTPEDAARVLASGRPCRTRDLLMSYAR